jgi:hypothetical protein
VYAEPQVSTPRPSSESINLRTCPVPPRELLKALLSEGCPHPLALACAGELDQVRWSGPQPLPIVNARSWHGTAVVTGWWQASQSGPSRRADAPRSPSDGL